MTKSTAKAKDGSIKVVYNKEEYYIDPSKLKIGDTTLKKLVESADKTSKDLKELTEAFEELETKVSKELTEAKEEVNKGLEEVKKYRQALEETIKGLITR